MRAMTFAALGDCAVVVSLGDSIDDTVFGKIRDLTATLEGAKIPGIIDIVPAYTTVTVFYDPVRFGTDGARPYPTVCQFISWCVAKKKGEHDHKKETALVEIPVCYGGAFGPDVARVASHAGLSESALIEAHSSVVYTVQAIGFAPGFPYLGGLPKKLSTPRLSKPRTRVPPGSVGIGGSQTGIYPLELPGGWNLVGRTPQTLFSIDAKPAALLKTGDRVKFRPISAKEFEQWK